MYSNARQQHNTRLTVIPLGRHHAAWLTLAHGCGSQAINELHEDEDFQRDAALPRVRAAVDDTRGHGERLERYADDAAVMGVMAKLRRFQARLCHACAAPRQLCTMCLVRVSCHIELLACDFVRCNRLAVLFVVVSASLLRNMRPVRGALYERVSECGFFCVCAHAMLLRVICTAGSTS